MNGDLALLAIVPLCLVATFAQPLPASAADESSEHQDDTVEIICLTEQPAIVEGEAAILKVWARTLDSQPIPLHWQVTEGHIEGQGAEVRWDLSAVKVEPKEGRKELVAIAKATDPKRHEARCAVEVFVGKKESVKPDRGTIRGENLLSGRRYLLPGESPEPGYGLYSYLLLGAPPRDKEETARYLKMIEAYLVVLQDVDEYMQRHVRPSKLNATFIPLKRTPESGNSNSEWASNVLAAYDYATAQILLGGLDEPYQEGPYLISALKPFSETNTVYLVEDLTGVVPELAWDCVRLFTYLAAQERSWSEKSLQRLSVSVRNLIAVGGRVAPDTVKGLQRMISFKRNPGAVPTLSK
jgi:hypothetical protein